MKPLLPNPPRHPACNSRRLSQVGLAVLVACLILGTACKSLPMARRFPLAKSPTPATQAASTKATASEYPATASLAQASAVPTTPLATSPPEHRTPWQSRAPEQIAPEQIAPAQIRSESQVPEFPPAIEPKATLATATVAGSAPAALASASNASSAPLAGDRPAPTAAPAIRLVIAGVRPERGAVKVAVYNSASAFPNPDRASQKFELAATQAQIETTLRASGRFAVGVFQDINSDGELNRNRLGIPTEPFAFSNNALGKRGPPSFDQAAIKAAEDSPSTVTIDLP